MSVDPSSDGGFVLIYRRLLENPEFRSDAEAMAFAWMVVRASWKVTRVRYKGRVIELQRGQLAISVRDMAERLERSKDWTKRFLDRLETATMIATDTATGVNIITVCKYDEYQLSSGDGATVPRQSERQDRDRTATQNNKGNEVNEEVLDSADAESVSAELADAIDAIAKHMLRLAKAKPTPCIEAMDLWNRYAARCGWPGVNKLSAERRKKLRLRLQEVGGLREWEGALARAEASDLLGCRSPPTWWKFDFLIHNETNILKVLEGQYDRRHSNRNGTGHHSADLYADRMRDPVLDDLARGRDPGMARAGFG